MIVTDTSVILELLLKGAGFDAARRELSQHANWVAPELLDVEAVQVLRRFVRENHCTPERAAQALDWLSEMPIERYPHQPLLQRIWQWRDNLTAYDAAYVALAEALGCAVITRDRKLARAAKSVVRLI